MLFIIGLLLGAVMVIFVLQNVIPVSVVFFGWHFDGSLALVLLLAILGGMLVSALLSLPEIIRKNFKLSRMASRNRELADELESHKQMLAEKPKVIERETIVVEDRDPRRIDDVSYSPPPER